ncbi:MAG: Gfo/Idh/MocA family oxidoreductase [Planctomycetota bacterium]
MAVIGARRRHQGVGAHLARFAGAAGADVVAVVGTSEPTVREAREALRGHGLSPAGYVDAEAMVDRERPDALVIASPAKTHDPFLELAAASGLHVLCEKPLCWGGEDAGARARRHAGAFRERNLHLAVHAQWPFTLDAYRRLFPDALRSPPARFHMRLCPDARGPAMIPEALPHALSLLAAVRPGCPGTIRAPRIVITADDASRLHVTFTYAAGDALIESRIELKRSRSQPREAAYGFDGHVATRRVEMDGYRLFLRAEGREVPLPDPSARCVEAFLARVSSGAAPRIDPAADPGVSHLSAILDAWPRTAATRPPTPRA